MKVTFQTEPTDVLYRIKRGLSSYVSYLAACEMNEAFSEYVLYEPMLRILTARGFKVKCEAPCSWIEKTTRGDFKKIDFDVTSEPTRASLRFAIEVKWARHWKLDVTKDHEKLIGFLAACPGSRAFICVFGKKSDIENVDLGIGRAPEKGKAVFAELRKTQFGCRIFEVSNTVSESVSESRRK